MSDPVTAVLYIGIAITIAVIIGLVGLSISTANEPKYMYKRQHGYLWKVPYDDTLDGLPIPDWRYAKKVRPTKYNGPIEGVDTVHSWRGDD